MTDKKTIAFARLLTIMNELREQCPWDKKQTMQSLRNLTIEETYELADAITDNNMAHVREEIGDIMLHLVFYARIAEEMKLFDVADVINSQCEKLVRRHPHIYGDVKVKDEDEVKKNWEQLKLKEGKKSVLQGVPVSLPAIIKAFRIQEKAAQVKFEWEHTSQVWDKVEEELQELKEASAGNHHEKTEEEFGDLLFSLVNLSRFINVDPEAALEKTNRKFIKRFSHIEETAARQGRDLNTMSLEEMDAIWNEAKKLP